MRKAFRFFRCAGKKAFVLVMLSVLLITAAVDATLSLLVTKTDTYQNVFHPLDLRISLEGANDITNVGDTPVYVRALAVATWLSTADEHTILSDKPKVGEDYNIDFVTDNWFLASDGFYYYKEVMKPGESLKLIDTVSQTTVMVGYELHLEIISLAIQAYPTDAVKEAWPAVDVNEQGQLIKASGR